MWSFERAMTIKSKYLIVVVIATFAAALICSPIITFAVPNRSNSGLASCTSTGKNSPGGLSLVQCCWHESVPKGTGFEGGDKEMYCSDCENGGTRGYINCSDPELIFMKKPLTSNLDVFPNDGTIEQPDTPTKGDDVSNPNISDGVLEQSPTISTPNPKDSNIIDQDDNDDILEQQ